MENFKLNTERGETILTLDNLKVKVWKEVEPLLDYGNRRIFKARFEDIPTPYVFELLSGEEQLVPDAINFFGLSILNAGKPFIFPDEPYVYLNDDL